MGTKLYVGNLNYNTNEQSLRELFSGNGREVVSVAVIMDRETGRSRGFAFVEMATAEGAQEALRELDGQDLDGRQLRINEARERESRGPGGPPRGPRPGGYGGGGGGYAGGGGGYAGGGGGPAGGGYGGGGDRPSSGAPAPSSDRARTFGPPATPGGSRDPKRGTGRKDKDREGGRPADDDRGARRGGARRRTGDDGDW